MTDLKKIEYRVRKITRYMITRFEEYENCAGSTSKGEYENEDTAFEVAYALCKAEHERLGIGVGDERISYPSRPCGQNVNSPKAE